jgi:hypothetical protein
VHEGRTVREVMERHYVDAGIAADGGFSDRWVVIRLDRVPVPFPNTTARRKALALHDVNHLVAGMSTGNVGEAEISAWELASGGCGKYLAAWVLDLAGMLFGMRWPIRTIRAFAAGRTMRNVYVLDADEVFDMDLTELRRELTRPDGRDRSRMLSGALFVGYLVLAIPVGLAFLPIVVLSLPVWALTKDRRHEVTTA